MHWMMKERVVDRCASWWKRLARSIAVLLLGVALAGLARADDPNSDTASAPVSAPGGGEMMILAPSFDYVLHGHVEDSGQVEADCVHDATAETGRAGTVDADNE